MLFVFFLNKILAYYVEAVQIDRSYTELNKGTERPFRLWVIIPEIEFEMRYAFHTFLTTTTSFTLLIDEVLLKYSGGGGKFFIIYSWRLIFLTCLNICTKI